MNANIMKTQVIHKTKNSDLNGVTLKIGSYFVFFDNL